MADNKISELSAITGANLADADEFVVVDDSAAQTKRITRAELANGGLGSLTVDGLTVDGSIASPAVASISNSGGTWTAGDEIGRLQFYTTDTSGVGARELASIRATSNQGGSTTDGTLEFWRGPYNSTSVKALEIDGNTGDISFYDSAGTSQDLFWDASTSRLGLGATSPDEDIHIQSSGAQIKVEGIGAGFTEGSILFQNSGTAGTRGLGTYMYDAGNDNEWFIGRPYSSNDKFIISRQASVTDTNQGKGTAQTTHALLTIDSSGNLLVSTTSTTPAVSNDSDGIALQSNGTVQFSANATTTAIINRKSTDGAILQFRKDGTTVGSIGAEGGDLVVDGGSGHAGIRFMANALRPRDDGTVSDGNVSLGSTAGRFADLYLSGSVYLGGTTSSNALDDYEEGTWTPACANGTISYSHATYTKIGRSVTVSAAVGNFSDRTSTSAVSITGIPFTSSSSQVAAGGVFGRYLDRTTTNASYISNGASNILFYNLTSANWGGLTHAELNNSSAYIYFSVTYFTDY